ncbi:phospholipase D-like domain-containing protein [Mesorhizobium onobrychidis]|uniref:Phospholipase D n=1 Tax=Mesorhizobium onobrychidis TaxID=2775404 RepID=A0ABY5R794_9HYPH|nr:phospholipase D-like domain-containing protein [Mesorhizobium onobrychidis]UVC19385.1 hypothetical protein IHQ72_35580 [Mesorhizobium onobrychidis]
MFWHDLFFITRDHVAAAERSLVIVAPFVKLAALRALLEATPANVEIVLYTRWRPDEIARGVSDTEILALVEKRGGTVWLLDALHAKIFLVDGHHALVGSANVTAAGLGLSRSPNFEILTPVAMHSGAAASLVQDLRARSQRATPEIAASVELAAALLTLPEGPFDPDAQDDIIGASSKWVPRFRSPDRLYDLYRDEDWQISSKPGDPALCDLLWLQLPKGLDRAAFDSHVRRRLLASSPIRVLDESLSEPRRFGALTNALQGVMPEMNHEELQAMLQLLLRWMLYFAPDLYELDTPNYSEIVSKRSTYL